MPNSIKYNTSAETLALKKGNFWIGTGDVGKGPTSSTGFYNGITPPSGGYTIYLNKVSGGPSIYTVNTEAQMVSLTNSIGSQSFTTSGQCLNWFATQTDKMIFNRDYEPIVTNGLVLNLDAGFTPSYPTTSSTWYDLSGNGNGTLMNEVTYISNPQSLAFDATNEYVSLTSNTTFSNNSGDITLAGWCSQLTSPGPHQTILCTSVQYRSGIKIMSYYHGAIAVWVANSDGTNDYLLGSTGIENTGWHYIVGTRNTSGELKLYLDGTLVNSVTTFSGSTYTSGEPAVARDYHSGSYYYYNGYISLTSGYNRVLSQTEITQNYNAQKGRYGL